MSQEILLIDDDPDILVMLATTLRSYLPELHIDTARSALAALELIADGKYDLIISDIIMPGLDGVDLLKVSRRVSPSTAVVLLTGGPRTNKAVALAEGAYAFLGKPFNVGELVSIVTEALSRARVSREAEAEHRAPPENDHRTWH